MFPFSGCVCQHHKQWLIITNNSHTTNMLLDNQDESKQQHHQLTSLIKIQLPIDQLNENHTIPDVTQPIQHDELHHDCQTIPPSYQQTYPFNTAENDVGSHYHYSGNDKESSQMPILDEKDIELLSLAHVNNVRRLLKIHKQKKFVKRRNSFVFLRKIQITTPDKLGLVDTCSLGLAQAYVGKFINSWKFNIFRLNRFAGGNSALIRVLTQIFHQHNLIQTFNINIDNLYQFFNNVQDVYHAFNPYHNSLHAADVAQAMHCFLLQDKLRQISSPLEVLGSIIAALCHDADHPGQNQFYLEKINHFFVNLYNHSSVLENHHCRVTMCILHESLLLNNSSINHNDWLKLQTFITKLILATDIAHQKAYLTKFMNLVREDKSTQELTADDKLLIFQMSMKCSDISNPCRSWPITLGWATLVCEEFFLQGDVEKKQGLPVMPTHDRCMTTKADIQLNFIRFVVRPLITQWLKWLQPQSSLQMDTHLDFNLSAWERYKQHHSLLLATKVIPVTPEPSPLLPPSIPSQDDDSDAATINMGETDQLDNSIATVTKDPSSCLATLTEESTLSSACSSNKQNQSSSTSRRLSLPEGNSSHSNKVLLPLMISPSTTLIMLSRSNLSNISSGPYPPPLLESINNSEHTPSNLHQHPPTVSFNINDSYNTHILDNKNQRRRGSLPQCPKPIVTTINKVLLEEPTAPQPTSSRRASLPLNVRGTMPIPNSWGEDNGVDTSKLLVPPYNGKKCASVPKSIVRANQYSRNERRGSAPTITHYQHHHHHHHHHVPCHLTTSRCRDTGLVSTCSRERLLLEVYWMNTVSTHNNGNMRVPAISSSVSSCASSIHYLYPQKPLSNDDDNDEEFYSYDDDDDGAAAAVDDSNDENPHHHFNHHRHHIHHHKRQHNHRHNHKILVSDDTTYSQPIQ